jgi:hypothetical protein
LDGSEQLGFGYVCNAHRVSGAGSGDREDAEGLRFLDKSTAVWLFQISNETQYPFFSKSTNNTQAVQSET